MKNEKIKNFIIFTLGALLGIIISGLVRNL